MSESASSPPSDAGPAVALPGNSTGRRANLARQITTATTRLILISIVTGGLLSATFSLWEPTSFFHAASPSDPSDRVAQFDAPALAALPISRVSITGDEQTARSTTLAQCRRILTNRLTTQGVELTADRPAPHLDAAEQLDADPSGTWAVFLLRDVPQRLVGVSRRGDESLICCWGGYEQTGPTDWVVWTMHLRPTEQ